MSGVVLAVVASPLLISVGLAGILAYLLNPLVDRLTNRTRLSRTGAAVIVFWLVLLILIGIAAGVGTAVINQIDILNTDLLAAITQIEEWLFQPVDILGFQLNAQDYLDEFNQMFTNALETLPGGSFNILTSVSTNLLWGTLVLVMLYYFLKDSPKIKPWLLHLTPEPYQPEFERLLDEVNHIWGRFMRIQLLLFLVLGTLMLLGTLLVVWLFRSGLLEWSFLGFVLLLLAVYTAVQQLDNLWLRPQFLGKQLHLHPGVAFAGLVGGLALSGFIGALVAVPLIATVRVIGRYVHRKLLGIPPWPDLAALETVHESDSAAISTTEAAPES
ncbi:MAG: AI-2E family transporter [Ardenticatenaceae bacterium]|nr:AI-2E family transporter [Ardenticatenaceae bacterium]